MIKFNLEVRLLKLSVFSIEIINEIPNSKVGNHSDRQMLDLVLGIIKLW